MVKRVAHIAIAVPELDAAAQFYTKTLGLKLTGRESVASQKVTVGFIPVGDTNVELVQPDSPDAPIAGFLAKRGPGLHHICFEVDDIDALCERLAAAGVRMIDSTPRPGAHGSRVAFIHPSATGGVLIELSQPAG
ncbi:MAG: methylmalonyl-CoA epimerase [bacterium]